MNPICKGIKLSLFEDDMVVYIENPEDATKTLLELISQLDCFVAQKINMQNCVAFPYTNNKLREVEIKQIIPLTCAPEKIKYLEINLPKEVKHLYSKKLSVEKN